MNWSSPSKSKNNIDGVILWMEMFPIIFSIAICVSISTKTPRVSVLEICLNIIKSNVHVCVNNESHSY